MQTHPFDAALRASGQILYEWDLVTDKVRWAGQVQEMLGYDAAQIGTLAAWAAIVSPEDLGAFAAHMETVMETGQPFCLEYRVCRPDGTEIWVEGVGRFIESGNPESGMAGMVRDVTARHHKEVLARKAREELARREVQAARQRMALLSLSARPPGHFDDGLAEILRVAAETLELTRVGYWAVDEEANFIRCEGVYPNPPDGWSPRGRTLAAEDFQPYFEALRRNEVLAVTEASSDARTACLGVLRETQSPRALLDVPVWADGRLCGIVCHEHEEGAREWTTDDQEFALAIAQQVSLALAARERRRMEGQLRLADRMVTVGTLCAGVAHEINNPLAYTLGNLSFLREALQGVDVTPISDLRAAVADAIDGATRVRDVVRDLRTFARPEEERLGPVRVTQVIDVAQRMAMTELRHRAHVVVDAREVPAVLGNESRLGQVLLNLLVNAAHAMPERPVERNEIRVTARHAGGRVTVEVSDNGIGIPPEAIDRVFDPFYTTKGVGQGTGLGLFVCHGIVASMGGEIELESTPGVGTTFRVHLPVAPGLALATGPAAASAPRLRRVLVIDDEPRVGSAIARMLASWSQVETVVAPHEGMRRILDGSYDVVLCDLMMPGMTGMELHGRIEAADAERAAGILFITGGAVTSPAVEFLHRMKERSIEKPFDAAQLRNFLDRILEGGAAKTTGSPSCSLPTRTSTSESSD